MSSGLQLPGVLQKAIGSKRVIYTDSDLIKYRARYSRTMTSDDSALGAFFTALTDGDEFFKYPKSGSESMEGIAGEIDRKIKVAYAGEVDGEEGVHSFIVTMPDGKTAVVLYGVGVTPIRRTALHSAYMQWGGLIRGFFLWLKTPFKVNGCLLFDALVAAVRVIPSLNPGDDCGAGAPLSPRLSNAGATDRHRR